jgi:hypothetical protein
MQTMIIKIIKEKILDQMINLLKVKKEKDLIDQVHNQEEEEEMILEVDLNHFQEIEYKEMIEIMENSKEIMIEMVIEMEIITLIINSIIIKQNKSVSLKEKVKIHS